MGGAGGVADGDNSADYYEKYIPYTLDSSKNHRALDNLLLDKLVSFTVKYGEFFDSSDLYDYDPDGSKSSYNFNFKGMDYFYITKLSECRYKSSSSVRHGTIPAGFKLSIFARAKDASNPFEQGYKGYTQVFEGKSEGLTVKSVYMKEGRWKNQLEDAIRAVENVLIDPRDTGK